MALVKSGKVEDKIETSSEVLEEKPFILKSIAEAWLVKLEAIINSSPDHPMARVAEVVEQMHNYLKED